MTGRARRSRAALVPASIAVVLTLASCAQVPRHGSVVNVEQRAQQQAGQPEVFLPKGPDPGARPADIVSGFLTAMTAIPLTTKRAMTYLSTRAQSQWLPDQRVVTYANNPVARGHSRVVVRLGGARSVGSRGQWQGSVPRESRRLVFPMVREGGEWRIARVPNALIVPSDFYDQMYQPATIYFFDPSGRILVPEPVHVPGGQQLASNLVRALVHGPGAGLSQVARSYIPPGLSIVSVPVKNGVAAVSMGGRDPGPLTTKATRQIIAQLTWTLHQDPTIRSFRLSIAGHPVTDSTGAQTFKVGVTDNAPLDPAVSRATSVFYALRKGRLVSGQIDHPTPLDGPFGTERLGIGAFAVSLDNLEVGAVASENLLMGPVNDPLQASAVITGPGLLRPAWDFAGRMWEVQNAPGGARVLYVKSGRLHHVRVPGITGKDVRRFLVSRDGSRLVAVLHGRTADRIVVSRLRYDAADVARHATPARRVPWISGGATRVRDIGWISPTTIEVLDEVSATQSEYRILSVDGSTSPDETTVTAIPYRSLALATSPVSDQTPYAVLRHRLYDLGQGDSARVLSPPVTATPGLTHITYAG